jgi:predicted dehydrogenase
MGAVSSPAHQDQPSSRRYAVVGAGHRAQLYIDAILFDVSDVAQLVAIADTNRKRANYHLRRAIEAGSEVEFVQPDALGDAIRRLGIDRVIVTTPDYLHAEFIEVALHAGADVVVEKPLTIDVDGARRIARAVEDTGREVVVTFNYRYSPRNSALKEVVQSGVIGTVTSVHFEWMLNTAHGADYFRRWHREKSNSGGLLVHKASHHFDLVNWWTGDSPRRVLASGGLKFYGDASAKARDLGPRPERGTHDGESDPFQLDLRSDPRLKSLYFDAEDLDGYLRDRDAFSSGITIEDTLSLLVDYDSGISMSYSLTAYSPWEGYRVSINGIEGRAELEVVENAAVLLDGDQVLDPSATEDTRGANGLRRMGEKLVVQRQWEQAYEVPIVSGRKGHGGGDALLISDVFRGSEADPLGRRASWIDGVRSVAVGIAGNRALEEDRPILISELGLGVNIAREAIR